MHARKFLASILAGLALAAVAFASAVAAPVSYVTGPSDVPQVMVNQALANVNASGGQFAILSSFSGASPIAATIATGRMNLTITGLTTAVSTTSAAQTVTDALVTAASQVICQVNGYTGTGVPVVSGVTPAAGSFTFAISNVSTGAALNANVPVSCIVFN